MQSLGENKIRMVIKIVVCTFFLERERERVSTPPKNSEMVSTFSNTPFFASDLILFFMRVAMINFFMLTVQGKTWVKIANTAIWIEYRGMMWFRASTVLSLESGMTSSTIKRTTS
jgi:hypothetical protein